MLVLNVWKNQKEIEDTFICEEYDLMYGTVEDILGMLDGLKPNSTNEDLMKIIVQNRTKINQLILDVFPDMDKSQVRKIKVKELVPFIISLLDYVVDTLHEKN